ncbi:MAG TPA: hypothetical protein VF585_07420 [Chthoniobacterales bacterium]|jgi:hypothetical protein
MNRSLKDRIDSTFLRVARHLQIIVIILFMLYLSGVAFLLLHLHEFDTPFSLLLALMMMIFPLPLFAVEALAVFAHRATASLVCVVVWSLLSCGSFLMLLSSIAQRGDDPFFLYFAFLFATICAVSAILAILHNYWPYLCRDSRPA